MLDPKYAFRLTWLSKCAVILVAECPFIAKRSSNQLITMAYKNHKSSFPLVLIQHSFKKPLTPPTHVRSCSCSNCCSIPIPTSTSTTNPSHQRSWQCWRLCREGGPTAGAKFSVCMLLFPADVAEFGRPAGLRVERGWHAGLKVLRPAGVERRQPADRLRRVERGVPGAGRIVWARERHVCRGHVHGPGCVCVCVCVYRSIHSHTHTHTHIHTHTHVYTHTCVDTHGSSSTISMVLCASKFSRSYVCVCESIYTYIYPYIPYIYTIKLYILPYTYNSMLLQTHKHSVFSMLLQTHKHSVFHTHTHTHSLFRTHTHSLSCTHTHTLSHTHGSSSIVNMFQREHGCVGTKGQAWRIGSHVYKAKKN